RRRHTRFSRDWSSDVCSSDLHATFNELSVDGDREARLRVSHDPQVTGSLFGDGGVTPALRRKRRLYVETHAFDAQLRQDWRCSRSEERRVGKEGRLRGGGRG